MTAHALPGPRGPADLGVGLWVFIGVATSLFTLFVAAYLMRMESQDWSSIGMPWQVWLSTALLAAGSAALQRAAAGGGRGALLAGGAAAAAFVAAQLWAWNELLGLRVSPYTNPAASFFFLLTAMHGLHVLGGLVGWSWAWRDGSERAMRLCARYWHFLLAVWLVLLATFTGVTPRVVAFICGDLS